MISLDTNILLRLLTHNEPRQAHKARAVRDQALQDQQLSCCCDPHCQPGHGSVLGVVSPGRDPKPAILVSMSGFRRTPEQTPAKWTAHR